MAKNDVPTAEQVAEAFQTIADYFAAGGSFPEVKSASGKSTAHATATAKKAGPAKDLDEKDTKALSIRELRQLAKELELDEQMKKAGILDELENKGFFGESAEDEDEEEDEEEGDEADDEDDEEDEDEERAELEEELEGMSLKELRDYAKSEDGGGFKFSDLKGKDKDDIVEMVLDAVFPEEDEEEDEDDDEGMEVSEEELLRMPESELRTLAKEVGVTVPRGKLNRKKIVAAVMEAAEEVEEDE